MKTNRLDGSSVSRRAFLGAGAATAAAASFTIVPRRMLGGRGYVPPSEKVNLAFIGTGSQGLRVMLGFLAEDDVQAVAVCDPNTTSAGYPQWGRSEFRNAVRRLIGTESGWEWLSPDDPVPLTPTLTATSGVAGREPCQKIVEGYYGSKTRSGTYRGCAAFADFRELLENQADVDAVVVGTADHLHAAVSLAAMRKGKHVFCQKPMTHSIDEARRMAEVAREAGVATQVAVGNATSPDTRRIAGWIADGAIGPVRQVLNWSSRPFWPQGIDRPEGSEPVPEGFDWDLWLGPAPTRPYHQAYLPFVWRGWYDFGSGALGDMGCYSFDTIFRALKLEAPTQVEASGCDRRDESYPRAAIVHYRFPARGDRPPVTLTWYDGGLKPPRPDALGDRPLEDEGLLFLGDDGAILCGFNGRNPRLIAANKENADEPPPRPRERSGGGATREWLDACKNGATDTTAGFGFSGTVTEALLLGNVALRLGRPLTWDRAGLRAVGDDAARPLIQPERRTGWGL
jgi:predicted dehydrogenase